MNPERLRRAPNIALVGSSSPLGKELREMFESSGFPIGKLTLLETEEYAGILQEFAGEIQITQIIAPAAFDDVDIAFFVCSPDIMKAYAASGSGFPELTVDLTQTRSEGALFLSGVSDPAVLRNAGYVTTPHPASIVLARVLRNLGSRFTVESAVVTVLLPASERGDAGIDELQQQTVGLLNFQQVESRTFAGQLAFNVLPEVQASSGVEELVRRQTAALAGPRIPSPEIAAVQAPVFHSHAFSMFVRIAEAPGVEGLKDCLNDSKGTIVVAENDDVSPVAVVGSDAIRIGRVHADGTRPGSYFLWIAADNLRLAASNAIQIAESVMLTPASDH